MGAISFTPTTWVDDSSPYITAAQLNRIEAGIDDLATGDYAAYQNWTPSLNNLSKGNGTEVARYMRIGNLIVGYYSLTFGSTSAMGTTPSVDVPVTPASGVSSMPVGTCRFEDVGTASYFGQLQTNGTTTLFPRVSNTSGTYLVNNSLTATVPFTWTTNDVFSFEFAYEAA